MELNLRSMEFEDGYEKKVQSLRKETCIECDFYIREDQVEILEEIGRGASGKVFKGKLYGVDDLKKGEYVEVALKEMNNRSKRDLSELNQIILNEVRL